MSLTKGLVLHCPLDEESYNPGTLRFTDNGAHGNHGTAANAGVFSADHKGIENRSCTFNGTSDFVNCVNNSSLNFGNNTDFSLCCWSRTSVTGAYMWLIAKGAGTTTNIYGIRRISSNVLQFRIENIYFSGNSIVNGNNFHHVCVTADRSGLARMYVNNVLQDNTLDISGIGDIDTSLDLKIGKHPTSSIQYHDGQIEDVRIYNRVLSTDEIGQLYDSYRPKLVIR